MDVFTGVIIPPKNKKFVENILLLFKTWALNSASDLKFMEI